MLKSLTIKCSGLIRILFTGLSLLYSHTVYSQITIVELAPVCNNDGVLYAANPYPGVTCTFTWHTNNGIVTHYTSGAGDSLTNFTGGLVFLQLLPWNGIAVQDAYGYSDFAFGVVQTIVPDSCPLQNGAISLAVSGGAAPYTYSWSLNGLPFPGITNAITNLGGGYYDCLVSDMNGCQVMLSNLDSNINGAFVPSINNIILNISTTPANCTNGTATVVSSGGNSPYTYWWSNGQTTAVATGLSAATTYTVSVTDADGCFQQSNAYLTSTVNMNVITNVTNSHCDDNDGAVTAICTGGTGPYTYLWNTFATTATISNIPAGGYQVTVTDAQGCIRNGSAGVASISPVYVNYVTTPSQCIGATGSVTPTVWGGTPPYTYEWFSSPVQITPVASGLAPGAYNFVITDSQGCTRSGIAMVPQNTTLQLTVSSTPNTCISNNGTATMLASGGVLPLTYEWSSGQTSSSISNMPSVNVYGTVTDADGCFRTDCIFIPYVSTLNILAIPQIASCIYSSDGSATLNIISGAPPFQYDWSTGAATSAISGLSPGYYSVIVTDANGCQDAKSFYIGYNTIAPCSGTIQGNVFIDLNNNCQNDPGEPVMSNIPIKCITTGDIDFTDAAGYYSFTVPPGNVTIEQLPLPYRYQVCPAANPFTLNVSGPGVVVTQDIADTVDWVTDLTVRMYNYSSPPVVGNTFVQRIVEFNRGTIAVPSTSQYDYDAQAPFVNSWLAPLTLNIPMARATFDNPLSIPLSSKQTDVTHSIPVTTPINTILTYTDTIFPVTGDTTWWDNMDFKQLITLGSFDPNYKEVYPAGSGPQGFISVSDSLLQYVIHFQNLGNYFAENIILLDTLDSDLDWNSLRVEYATHVQTASISPGGLLQFTFNNINLPSLSQSGIYSNGFVAYTIKLKPNLADGTQITNSADIYFDYNAPVRTNTTINTIQITGIESAITEIGFTVYPNPNRGSFTLLFHELLSDPVEIQLFNVTGQLVYHNLHSMGGTDSLKVDTKHLSPGIYTLRCTGKQLIKNTMIVIE